MNKKLLDFFHLQFIVVVLSFTAVLGKLINMSALYLVWWRLVIAILGLFVFLLFTNKKLLADKAQILKYLLIGVIVGLHWLCFFGAVKLSNISVTLVVMSSTTLFTGIIEPLLLKENFKPLQLLFGFIIIAGIALIFSFETNYKLGIIVALLAALSAALFTALNKKVTQGKNSGIASFYELTGGFITLSVVILFTINDLQELTPNKTDFIWLAILGVVCTSYAYTASVKVMRSLSAYVVSMSINMEPIYGIVLAYVFFAESENMTSHFYLGTAIVLVCILLYPIVSKKSKTNGKN